MLCLLVLLSACGGDNGSGAPPAPPAPSNSQGQVAAPALAQKVSFYAASRFAEQASFGPTPALVAELQAKGFERWIDEQFALPASQIDLGPYVQSEQNTFGPELTKRYQSEFPQLALAAPDQLRVRTTWSISQFIVNSDRKGDGRGNIEWINLLLRNSLGRYDQLLYEVTLNPAMGFFLDNLQNRPKSSQCPHCAPNENYARELMQLFSIGVIQLNSDGTPKRDARGRFFETYTQRDVEELARVLTGWSHDGTPGATAPPARYDGWIKPMVPTWAAWERDSGRKQVMGKVFPAGQTPYKDLRDAIDMLMEHPNIAPFVAFRLIQHFVKSNPTPAYVERVAKVFINNGQGVRGDLKAVVRALLLDTEARAGDVPGQGLRDGGKFREPFLYSTALWRGLGCQRFPKTPWEPNGPALTSQQPFHAESVFSFYAPTDRVPGSNLLAPEQRLVTGPEFRNRLSHPTLPIRNSGGPGSRYQGYTEAGCDIDGPTTLWKQSPRALLDWMSMRYFRGAMPPALRAQLEQFATSSSPPWPTNEHRTAMLVQLNLALSTSSFGVMK